MFEGVAVDWGAGKLRLARMITMKTCPNESFTPNAGSTFIADTVSKICATYQDKQGVNHIEGFNLPSQTEITEILKELRELIFPGFSERKILSLDSASYVVGDIISRVYVELCDQIARSFRYNCEMTKCVGCDALKLSEKAARHLIGKLPEIREVMKLDIVAAYDGDPAAKSYDEVILSYPGIRAICTHRIAHELYAKDVQLIPRMMSECAHSETGIDIHPGARIGKRFFIDHGTGVVIGETAVIGDNVKIFQGVTLGALSFPKDENGRIIKGHKRHPTIEDDVTIYAGATILGDIVVGKGSVIGGNVWYTETVEPHTVITIAKPDLTIKSKKVK